MYSMDNLGSSTIAMVLAGGKGERLSPLTLHRLHYQRQHGQTLHSRPAAAAQRVCRF